MRALSLLFCVSLAVSAADHPAPKLYSEVREIQRGVRVLWHDPGAVEHLNLRTGPGGASMLPKPPYRFIKEDDQGSTPKVLVRDAVGREWSVKFGDEARPDAFGARLAWALGYYAVPTHFIRAGVFRGVGKLEHTRDWIDERGRFREGRFQLRAKSPRFLPDVDWAWTDNPFLGTPQFNGLKILMMLVSNWDNKDIRDAAKRGSNTGILQSGNRYLFYVNDWGASLGHWGHYFTRSKWESDDFYLQSPKFLRVKDGVFDWGYKGQHSDLMTEGIRLYDVRWLLRYLGRLSDGQLRSALLASGASRDESWAYTAALRIRIRALQQAARQQRSAVAVAGR